MTLQECLSASGFPEQDWPFLTASQRAIAVVTAHRGERVPMRQPKKRVALSRASVVYFLGAGPFVKIGKALGDAKSRASTLQTGCPYETRILALVPGGKREERELHQRFSSYRAHGEWFRHEGGLADYIRGLE